MVERDPSKVEVVSSSLTWCSMETKIIENQVLYEFQKTYDKENGLNLFSELQAKHYKDVLVNPICVGAVPYDTKFKILVIGSFGQISNYKPL